MEWKAINHYRSNHSLIIAPVRQDGGLAPYRKELTMAGKISDHAEIIRLYNTVGRSRAYAYIREHYGVKNPYSVIKRMKQSAIYHYDASSDCFKDVTVSDTEHVFIGINELCQVNRTIQPIQDESGMSMEKLIKELIEERLLQLSHYIQMNQATRTVMVDQSSMISDGYRVIIH